MKRVVTVFAGLIICLSNSFAWADGGDRAAHELEASQNFFISHIFLRRVMGLGQFFHFEACDRQTNSCKVITRDISPAEAAVERLRLEREVQFRFRRRFRIGTVLFSQDTLCTEAGIVIAAVPGLAGGAMICVGPKQKLQVTELPLSIQALERLGRQLGPVNEVVAKGEDGEIYVANLEMMIHDLKTRYPMAGERLSSPSSESRR